MKDYYYLLGIARDASVEEVKMAFRKLSRKFHPDTNGGDEFYEKRFKELVEAYETLSDKNKRREFDERLHNSFIYADSYENESYWEEAEEDFSSSNESNTFFQSIQKKFGDVKVKMALLTSWLTLKKGASSKNVIESVKENSAFLIVKRLTFLLAILCSLFVLFMFVRLNSKVLKGITSSSFKEKVEENYKCFRILKNQFEKGDYQLVSDYVEKIDPELFYCNNERNQYEALSIISYFKLGDWNALKKYENKISSFEKLVDKKNEDSRFNNFIDLRGCCKEENCEVLIEEGIGEQIKNSLELKPNFLKLVRSEIEKDKDIQKKGLNQVAAYLQFNKRKRLSIFSKLIEIDSSFNLSFYESEIEKVALEQISQKFGNLEKKQGGKDLNFIYDPYKTLAPVKLKNGNSPFSNCFKEGIDELNNSRLIVHNEYENDMIFLLKDIKSGKIIRNEYIKSKTNYKLRYIPNGEYRMIQIYGDCWIDKNDVKHSCGDKGMFTKDVWYAVPEKNNGIISIPQCGNAYTVKQVSLNPIVRGKLKAKFPLEKDIFN